MGKMRMIKTVTIITMAIMSWIVFGAPSCALWQDYYWNYECDWVSEDSQIVLNKGCGDGWMVINGVEYEFLTAISNNAVDIEFHKNIPKTEGHSIQSILWVADTELKDGKLYLTITTDNISNYVGKTIILYQRPVQNEEPTN